MPELPEVETTRRGIEPHLVGQTVKRLLLHDRRLRWPIPDEVLQLEGSCLQSVRRRGKYLLLDAPEGSAIVHLGMSGSLRICDHEIELRKHDHVELQLDSGKTLRLHDPRRFGCFLWQAQGNAQHSLLAALGPEPLSDDFDATTLINACHNRKVAIKNLIMNSHVVVGVGNIYASESLFLAGIRPGRASKGLTRREVARLADTIKAVLGAAIEQGGTTLRDFVNSDGNPGYFAQSLYVYGREGQTCKICDATIKQRVIGQRSTFYCNQCQR